MSSIDTGIGEVSVDETKKRCENLSFDFNFEDDSASSAPKKEEKVEAKQDDFIPPAQVLEKPNTSSKASDNSDAEKERKMQEWKLRMAGHHIPKNLQVKTVEPKEPEKGKNPTSAEAEAIKAQRLAEWKKKNMVGGSSAAEEDKPTLASALAGGFQNFNFDTGSDSSKPPADVVDFARKYKETLESGAANLNLKAVKREEPATKPSEPSSGTASSSKTAKSREEELLGEASIEDTKKRVADLSFDFAFDPS
eukprot:m.116653 g.116653  ORF g.116653 m.116653 type:complete len:251 (-) comp14237_c0_seq2:74-826(-)